jgi:hypothetical protein
VWGGGYTDSGSACLKVANDMGVLEAGQRGDFPQDAGVTAGGVPRHQNLLDGVHAAIQSVDGSNHQPEAPPAQPP